MAGAISETARARGAAREKNSRTGGRSALATDTVSAKTLTFLPKFQFSSERTMAEPMVFNAGANAAPAGLDKSLDDLIKEKKQKAPEGANAGRRRNPKACLNATRGSSVAVADFSLREPS